MTPSYITIESAEQLETRLQAFEEGVRALIAAHAASGAICYIAYGLHDTNADRSELAMTFSPSIDGKSALDWGE